MGDTPRRRGIDFQLATRLQRRRRQLAMSQRALAQRIGVSLEQLQRYEWGQDRISASMLVELAQALDAPVPYFFCGIEAPANDERPARLSPGASDRLVLLQAFLAIRSPALRLRLLHLARELGGR